MAAEERKNAGYKGDRFLRVAMSMSATPVRLQLSRRKGFDLQAQSRARNGLPAARVSRPGKWGNPFQAGALGIPDAAEAVRRFRLDLLLRLSREPDLLEPLRKKNLACWCRPGQPCHADVLLDLANR
jgi:hypothetical protein